MALQKQTAQETQNANLSIKKI